MRPAKLTQLIMQPTGPDSVDVTEVEVRVYLDKVTALSPAKVPSKIMGKNGQPVVTNGCIIRVPGMNVLVDKTVDEVEEMIEESKK